MLRLQLHGGKQRTIPSPTTEIEVQTLPPCRVLLSELLRKTKSQALDGAMLYVHRKLLLVGFGPSGHRTFLAGPITYTHLL